MTFAYTSRIEKVVAANCGSYTLPVFDEPFPFGLGATARVESVLVRWPSGHVERWSDIAADQILTLKEASGTPATWEPAR